MAQDGHDVQSQGLPVVFHQKHFQGIHWSLSFKWDL